MFYQYLMLNRAFHVHATVRRILVGLLAVILSSASCSNSSSSPASGNDIPTGGLREATTHSTFGLIVDQVLVADLNGDGRNDAVALSAQNQRVLIYYQAASGTFDRIDILDTPNDYQLAPRQLAVGDLNNDGSTDLVVTGIGLGQLSDRMLVVFYQDRAQHALLPGQRFQVTNTFSGYPPIPYVGDINSDGRDDLVLSTPDQQLVLRYQDANGLLGSETFYDKFPVFHGVVHIADMDNDGDNDLVVRSGHKEMAVIKQDSDSLPGTLSDTPERYQIQTSYWPDHGPSAVGDLNHDGKMDLVVSDPGNSGLLNIFLQNNQGTLDPARILPQLFIPWAGLHVIDINRDGLDDIVSGSVDAGFPAMSSTYVMFQLAGQVFSNPVAYSIPTKSGGGGTVGFAIADVTNDGRLDAVIAWMDEGLFVMPNFYR